MHIMHSDVINNSPSDCPQTFHRGRKAVNSVSTFSAGLMVVWVASADFYMCEHTRALLNWSPFSPFPIVFSSQKINHYYYTKIYLSKEKVAFLKHTCQQFTSKNWFQQVHVLRSHVYCRLREHICSILIHRDIRMTMMSVPSRIVEKNVCKQWANLMSQLFSYSYHSLRLVYGAEERAHGRRQHPEICEWNT